MSGAGRPTLVVSSTFPQYPGDHRGLFLLRYWQARAATGERVVALVPQTAWTAGTPGTEPMAAPLEIRRFAYAPRPWSTLTGHFGTLENIRERPWRALLVPAYALGLHRALRRALAELRPRRVVAHFLLPGGWLVVRAAAAAGVPCELYGHGTDIDVALRLPGPLRRRLAADLLQKKCTRVALPSADKRRRLAQGLGLSAIPDHFVVETMVETVTAAAAAPGAAEPRGGVLFVGRLIRQKGVDDLLRAALALRPAVPLEIAGDGPERPRLERLARSLGVAARFHGFVEPPLRARLCARAAVVCVPSRPLASGLSEGAPLVIREARAHGAAVVASAVGGIPELCAGDPGAILVPPGSPERLALALGRALESAASSSLSSGLPEVPEVGPIPR